jgi:hypothetical protein
MRDVVLFAGRRAKNARHHANGVRAADGHSLCASIVMAVPQRVTTMLTCADVIHHRKSLVVDDA